MPDFCFAHEELFVIPIEALEPNGIRNNFAEQLRSHNRVTDAWINSFNAAFRLYWTRAEQLHALAPDDWYPPRKQNIFVVCQPNGCRPFAPPLPGSSWLLFASDFEPSGDPPELAAYLFLHAERTSLCNSLLGAFIRNISYFSHLSREQIQCFRRQCKSSARPDSASFLALAEFLNRAPSIFHPTLNPLPRDFDEPCGRLDDGNVLVPARQAHLVQDLAQAIRQDGKMIVEDHFQRHSIRRHNMAEKISTWLQDTGPNLELHVEDAVIWTPEKPGEVALLHSYLDAAGDSCCDSLLADMQIIQERSYQFVSALQAPDVLPRSDDLEQEGSLYIDSRSHRMIYSLREPTLDLLREPTPPYGRLLLGARTVHEWAHLAVAANLVGVPTAREEKERADRKNVERVLDAIVGRASGACRALHDHELRQIAADTVSPGKAWSDYIFTRLADFQCNLLLPRFATSLEVESYVRRNARCHHEDTTGLYTQIMRYVFESQYLRLCGMAEPLQYIMDSSWFDAFFVAPGIIRQDEMAELFASVEAVCSHQTVRDDAFKPGA